MQTRMLMSTLACQQESDTTTLPRNRLVSSEPHEQVQAESANNHELIAAGKAFMKATCALEIQVP